MPESCSGVGEDPWRTAAKIFLNEFLQMSEGIKYEECHEKCQDPFENDNYIILYKDCILKVIYLRKNSVIKT